MKKILLGLIISLYLIPNAYGFKASNIFDIFQIGKRGKKIERIKGKLNFLKNITITDLKYFSCSDNLKILLNKAVQENKIKATDSLYYYKKFNSFDKGDRVLLKCLQSEACDIDNYLDVVSKSDLHKKIIYKYTSLNLHQINQKDW